MLFKKNETNHYEDNELKVKMKKSKFVFSYGYGILSSEVKSYTQLVVLDDEIIVKKLFTNEQQNVYKTLKKEEQCKQVREYFLQKGVQNQLEVMNNIPPKDLKHYKNSRIDIVYLKVNGKSYSFDGNSANMEYRNFFQKIIKKVYSFLNINYLYNNNKYKVSVKAPANWIELNTEYGHPIFKFVPINISKSQTLFKFSGIVSFSPALYGQYSVEKIGEGTIEEFNNAFDNFIKFISAEENNYKLIKKDKIELKNKIIKRSFIRYTNSNVTAIVDYVYIDGHILTIGCPLCLNLSDEESLLSKNVELNNHIIDTIKMYNDIKIIEKDKKTTNIDLEINGINISDRLNKISEDYIKNNGKKLISEFVHSIIPVDKSGDIFWTKTSEDVLCYLIMYNLKNNNKVNLEILEKNLENFAIFKEICQNSNYDESNKEYANIVNVLKKSTDNQLHSYYEIMLTSLKFSSLTDEDLQNKGDRISNVNNNNNKVSFEEMVKNRVKDPFWAATIIKYFSEELKNTDIVAKLCFKDLMKYDDILNEFTKYLTQRTYDIKNSLEVNGYTAKQISDLNPKFTASGVYTFMQLLRDNKDKAENIIKSGFASKDVFIPSKINDEVKDEIVSVETSKQINLSDDLVDLVCNKLNINKEQAIQNCKELTEIGAYYFWNTARGGLSVIIKNNGEMLFATSGVNFQKHLEEFNNGKRNEITDEKVNIKEANEKFKDSHQSFYYIFGSIVKKDYKIIRVVEDYIISENFINGKDNSKVWKDKELTIKIWNIINENLEKIKKCSEDIQKVPRVSANYNDSIIIKIYDKNYGFSSLTTDKNIERIYKEISKEILDCLDFE